MARSKDVPSVSGMTEAEVRFLDLLARLIAQHHFRMQCRQREASTTPNKLRKKVADSKCKGEE